MVEAPVLKDLNIASIAALIAADWGSKGNGVNFAAKPYLDAMRQINDVDQMYGMDDARSIVRYFLSNATHYRGEQAKAIKAELKRRL